MLTDVAGHKMNINWEELQYVATIALQYITLSWYVICVSLLYSCELQTFLEQYVGDDCTTEGAGCACRPVLCQRAQAGLAEDVAAGLAHVGAEVDVQTHGTGVAFALLLILAAGGRESLHIGKSQEVTHSPKHRLYKSLASELQTIPVIKMRLRLQTDKNKNIHTQKKSQWTLKYMHWAKISIQICY